MVASAECGGWVVVEDGWFYGEDGKLVVGSSKATYNCVPRGTGKREGDGWMDGWDGMELSLWQGGNGCCLWKVSGGPRWIGRGKGKKKKRGQCQCRLVLGAEFSRQTQVVAAVSDAAKDNDVGGF